jgi:hypothetical protein
MQLQHPVAARFGDEVELIGFEMETTEYRPGETVAVDLFLRTRRPVAVDYTAGFYLLRRAAGQPVLVAQDDRRPQIPIPSIRPRFTSGWLPGEVAQERYAVSIPPTAAGPHELWLALYELNTLRRLRVDGSDHIRLIEITIAED